MKRKITCLRFLLWTAVISAGVSIAGCYDDTAVLSRLEQQAARLAALDKTCSDLNTNIASLQKIIEALQKNDYVTSVTPVKEDGKVVGYTLAFASSGPVTIYHGRNGADGADGTDGANGTDGKNGTDGRDGIDGSVPVIGVMQDEDGLWYWTLNGEWLLDDNGDKVKAVGKDGADGSDGSNGRGGTDGITPQLKVEEGYWYLSLDGGQTWENIGRATGDPGRDGFNGLDGFDGNDGRNGYNGRNGHIGHIGTNGVDGDTMFTSIVQTGNSVTITLSNGQTIVVPMENPLSITFTADGKTVGPENPIIMPLNYTALTVKYVVTSNNKNITVATACSEDMDAMVIPDATNPLQGIINIKSGLEFEDLVSKVIVFVSDGTHTIMRSLSFDAMKLYADPSQASSVNLNYKQQTLIYKLHTNYPFSVVVPDDAKSWIHIISTKTTEEYNIKMTIDKNESLTDDREATVTIKNSFNALDLRFTISQKRMPTEITFSDSKLKALLIANGIDTDGDGIISTDEAAAVKSLETLIGADTLFVKSSISSFDEFKYFTGIDTIPAGSFRNWTQLTSITLPESIKVIDMDFDATDDNSIFRNCPNLTKFKGKFSTMNEDALLYKGKLIKVAESVTNFTIPAGTDTIVRFAFYNSNVQDLTIPESVKVIGESAFEFSKVDTVIISVNSNKEPYVKKIGEKSFAHCYNLIAFMGPEVNHKDGAVRVTPNRRYLCVDSVVVAYTLGSTEKQVVMPDDWGLKKLSDHLFDVVDMDGQPLTDAQFKYQLQTIVLPKSVNHIGDYTFRNEKYLTDVYFHGQIPPYYCGQHAFDGCHFDIKAVIDSKCSDQKAWKAVMNIQITMWDSWVF